MRYSPDMAKVPITALVMHPVVRDELMREDHMERLRAVTRLIREEPFRDIRELDADLKNVEVLVTSWGVFSPLRRRADDVQAAIPRGRAPAPCGTYPPLGGHG